MIQYLKHEMDEILAKGSAARIPPGLKRPQ